MQTRDAKHCEGEAYFSSWPLVTRFSGATASGKAYIARRLSMSTQAAARQTAASISPEALLSTSCSLNHSTSLPTAFGTDTLHFCSDIIREVGMSSSCSPYWAHGCKFHATVKNVSASGLKMVPLRMQKRMPRTLVNTRSGSTLITETQALLQLRAPAMPCACVDVCACALRTQALMALLGTGALMALVGTGAHTRFCW